MHKFTKCTVKKLFDTFTDINLALLQMKSMAIESGIPCPATLLFNQPIRIIMQRLNRAPINYNYHKHHYHVLEERQNKANENDDFVKYSVIIPLGSTIVFRKIIVDCGHMEQ